MYGKVGISATVACVGLPNRSTPNCSKGTASDRLAAVGQAARVVAATSTVFKHVMALAVASEAAKRVVAASTAGSDRQ